MRSVLLSLVAVLALGIAAGCRAKDKTVASQVVGHAGGLVQPPNGKACVEIPQGAVRDSVRVDIRRLSPSDESLPEKLPAAFATRGLDVRPPMYEISFTPREALVDSFVVGLCVLNPTQEARIAHDRGGVLEVLDSIAPCDLKCPASTALGPLRRLIDGSPATPTPAWAAYEGLGGKGGSGSAFAAIGNPPPAPPAEAGRDTTAADTSASSPDAGSSGPAAP